MNIFPAIDLINGQVVRLLKGDYDKVTVYGNDPVSVAKDFEACGAEYIHIVDLDAAKDGKVHNFDIIKSICEKTNLKVEIGGGVRSEDVIKQYIDAGVFRVILGTIAIKNPDFTKEMIKKYGERIAIGVDISDGMVAIHGWTQVSSISCDELFSDLECAGASCVICTDISKDGAMQGTNLELYRDLSQKYSIHIVASGGVSSMDDIRALKDMNLYGAILGKALYTGAVDLKDAIEVAK
ncbi:MAG: 1-(5-phosphoribosyl)-5-[Clostridia bacterium]|nr:1-(5-phosphoribosyl)-5-[(5-phosphoribosylamino)methylideneamino]imidazole-4-carboxamide isomerase [Clostridia bacterium]